MKIFFLLTFVAFNSWALEIPVEIFDQSKLEFILRKIPSAELDTEERGSFVRKFTRYPKSMAQFSIQCEADYYGSSPVPSDKRCSVTVSDNSGLKNDEYLFNVTGNQAAEMFNSLPYGQDVKKAYSHERVYGRSYEGRSHDLFRFMITCKTSASCEVRFTAKEAY